MTKSITLEFALIAKMFVQHKKCISNYLDVHPLLISLTDNKDFRVLDIKRYAKIT